MAELGNEDEARALYRRSPGLVQRYPNETRFLDYLKTYQSVIQTPPLEEPINDGQRYFVFPLPTTTTLHFRFQDGTTVSVILEYPGLFRFPPEGQEVLDALDIQAARMLPGSNR